MHLYMKLKCKKGYLMQDQQAGIMCRWWRVPLLKNRTSIMDVGTGGGTGCTCLHFSKILVKCPLTCLPSSKALKMQKQLAKCTFPAISEGIRFKISMGSMPPDPPANLHLWTGPFSLYKECYRFIRCFIPRQSA